MLYKLIKKGGYDKEDMLNKLDTFYVTGRITQAQYMQLLEMVSTEEAPILKGAEVAIKNEQFEPFKLKTDGFIKMHTIALK